MFYRMIIRMSNFMARKRCRGVPPAGVLVLLPHCLQSSECEKNLVHDVNKCARCGKCDIAAILEMCDELGVKCAVVGGGREAVRLARDPGVRAIVACACEKELVDGIRAAFPKPVLAVPNTRPHGPCKDTRADIAAMRSAILAMIDNKQLT